eukprot:GFKZ01010464.1.p2 GENE.GFKZ01010464.1~~GFKZ01010464.1.p2  ORF type:complete len:119 (+),score=8.65 GFKZ01010464.1:358-714(+)
MEAVFFMRSTCLSNPEAALANLNAVLALRSESRKSNVEDPDKLLARIRHGHSSLQLRLLSTRILPCDQTAEQGPLLQARFSYSERLFHLDSNRECRRHPNQRYLQEHRLQSWLEIVPK